MAKSYREITPEAARRIKLLMADVDGTLNGGGDALSPAVVNAVHGLHKQGIIVGLVSGRTDPMLEAMALELEIKGPIIAENGAVARLTCQSRLVDLGHSRQPAQAALDKLKATYPGRIREREDNAERMIDIVFWADGVRQDEIKACVGDVQVLDSTYIMHLMQKGIDKGRTLQKVLKQLEGGKVRPEEVLVIGDSMTDLSLFELFPESVLVPNPNITAMERQKLHQTAKYVSDNGAGDGFAEVALHIIHSRT